MLKPEGECRAAGSVHPDRTRGPPAPQVGSGEFHDISRQLLSQEPQGNAHIRNAVPCWLWGVVRASLAAGVEQESSAVPNAPVGGRLLILATFTTFHDIMVVLENTDFSQESKHYKISIPSPTTLGYNLTRGLGHFWPFWMSQRRV